MTTTTRYSYMHAPRVRWGWGAMTLGSLLLPLTHMALIAQGHGLPGERLDKHARAAALCAAIFASPWWTMHELGNDHLVLRQGLNFHGRIAYDNIAAVHATERTASGLPLRLYPHTLFLALWPVNLVAIRLHRPQRFRLFHTLPSWPVREVVISVDRREAFVADLRARVATRMQESMEERDD